MVRTNEWFNDTTAPEARCDARRKALNSARSATVASSSKLAADAGDGLRHQRRHPRPGVLVEAGEVEHAFEPTGDGVLDRHAHARERAERLGVVLRPLHQHGPALLGRGAHAVGAHHVLGVGVARHQPDAVEQVAQRLRAGAPVEHAGVGIGQHDGGAGVGQRRREPVEHGRRQRGEAARGVGVGGQRGGEGVAGDARAQGAGP
nr:hypothetical protein [Aquihabitans sp. G128]